MTVRPRPRTPGEIDRDHLLRIRRLEAVVADTAVTGVSYDDGVLAEAGLWSYWPCDDASGGLVDIVGGRDLTQVATPQYLQAGPFPGAFAVEFLGTDGVGNPNDDQFTRSLSAAEVDAVTGGSHAFTFECLAYFYSTPASVNGRGIIEISSQAVMSTGASANDLTGTRNPAALASGYGLPYNTWVHIAITYDGTTMRIYVGGVLVASNAQGANPTGGGATLKIGNAFSFNGYMKGRLSRVAIYADDLSAATLAAHALAADVDAAAGVYLVSSAHTISETTEDVVVLATGTITVTLPAASATFGKRATIKNIGSGTITVARSGSDNIDGAASNVTMATTKMSREFVSDGAGWQIISGYL